MIQVQVKARRITAVFLFLLGIAGFSLAAMLPLLLSDPVLGFVLMGLPLLFGGAVALLHGFAMFCSELTLDRQGLHGRLPAWRGFPTPPCQTADFHWEQVQRISHRCEDYCLAIVKGHSYMPLLPVDAYLVEYEGGRLLLAGNMLPKPAAIVESMAALCGADIRELPPVTVNAFQSLRGNLPPWD
jgi:hypothetical protein